MATIAFIGLGTMGLPMAHNLVRAGHEVRGFDINPQACERHRGNGGVIVRSAQEAVEGVDVVFTMLPIGKHVQQALDSCIEAIPATALFIEMSTIHPLESDEIRVRLRHRSIAMVDAPVGRTSEHAYAGTLLIMAGGEKADIARASPFLQVLGDPIIDCGGPGMGARVKIINNFLSNMINVATAEALTLAEVIGLDRDLAMQVMAGTAAGQGHMATTYPSKVLKGDLSPAFMLDLAHKDQGLALDLAAAMKVETALGQVTQEVYAEAQAKGFGRQDWTSVYAMMREKVRL